MEDVPEETGQVSGADPAEEGDRRDADDDDDSSDEMARPSTKFIAPPVFWGKPEDDVEDYIERYERIGHYNRWGEDQLRENLVMYLEGSARKWYLCMGTIPDEWDLYTAAVPATRNGAGEVVAAVPERLGLKQLFLREFKRDNYTLFQEARLRSRRQGPKESATEYFYDVMDLCRTVNPTMTEGEKLERLMQGLLPDLIRHVYPLRPKTCASFLAALKTYGDAETLAARKFEPEATVAAAMTETGAWKGANRGARGTEVGEKVSATQTAGTDQLALMVKELQAEVKRLRQDLAGSRPNPTPGPSRGSGGDAANPNNRSAKGAPICFQCNKRGHIRRHCKENPDAVQRPEKKAVAAVVGEDTEKERPAEGVASQNMVAVATS